MADGLQTIEAQKMTQGTASVHRVRSSFRDWAGFSREISDTAVAHMTR
jgi:hypothetical protein